MSGFSLIFSIGSWSFKSIEEEIQLIWLFNGHRKVEDPESSSPDVRTEGTLGQDYLTHFIGAIR